MDYIHGRRVKNRLRLQSQGIEYLLMTHYNMGLDEVRNLNVDDTMQLMDWAMAMQKSENKSTQGSVYLGYDYVPPLE